MNTISIARAPSRAAIVVTAVLTALGVVSLTPGTARAAAAPSIVAVSPAATVGMGAGQSGHAVRSVTLSVDNLSTTESMSVSFPSWSGLSVGAGTRVVNGSHTDVPVSISTSSSTTAGITPNLTLSTSNGSDTQQFTVTAAPTLTGVSPAYLLQGTTTAVTLTGTGMQTGVTASGATSSGVSFTNVVRTSSSQATADAAVTNSAPLGPVAVTLTNPDMGWSTRNSALTVEGFRIDGISPDHGSNYWVGSAQSVTITGNGIPSNSTLSLTPTFSVNGQSPITASPTSVSSTSWTGNVDLRSAAAGSYLVQLVSSGHTGTLLGKYFTVDSYAAPTVSSVSPTTLGQGAETTLTVYGENFARGASVSFSSSAITTTGPATYGGHTVLTVPIKVATNAATGSSNAVGVTVTNINGGSGSKSGAIVVTTGPTLRLPLVPSVLGQGATATLTIYGYNFSSAATVAFGTGVSALGGPSVRTNISPNLITLPIRVDASAPTAVEVKVVNPDRGSAKTTLSVTPFRVSAVSPQYVPSTYTGTLAVSGYGFTSGATVTFPNGSGVTLAPGKAPYVSGGGTTISVPVVVSRSTPGAVDVTVTNTTADLGSSTCVGCLKVAVAPSAPAGAMATKTGTGTTASLTWLAVPDASNGGAPITGYTVSVSDPATSGIASQSLSATATSTTFIGLLPDVDYTFALVAKNAAGLESTPALASTSRQSSLTIAANDRRIVSGQTLRLSGTLLTYAGDPIGGATVTIYRQPDTGARTQFATATTDAAGQWSLYAAPRSNATFDAAFAGDVVNWASTSAPLRVRVQPRISIRAEASGAASDPFVVRGRVAPNKGEEIVRLVARDSTGTLHRLGSTFLSPRSTYRFHIVLGHGTWRLQVRIGPTLGNASGHSPYLPVTRH